MTVFFSPFSFWYGLFMMLSICSINGSVFFFPLIGVSRACSAEDKLNFFFLLLLLYRQQWRHVK